MDIYELERRWQARLREVSLVGQVDFNDDEIERACEFVSHHFQTRIDPERRNYFAQFPAAVLIAITSAARDYEGGVFWPKLANRLGLPIINQNGQASLASIYSQALDALGLERFSTPRARIGEMLVHATVPDSCLNLFTHKLINLFKKNPNTSGLDVVDYFQSIQRGKVQAHEINIPILDFVVDAGDIAPYFIDECMSLISAVAEKKDTESVGLGLATHSREVVLRAASDAKISTRGNRNSESRGHRARFVLDPISLRLFLALPSRAGQSSPELWTVQWSEREFSDYSYPPVAGVFEPTLIPLIEPGSQAVLTNKETGEEVALSLWVGTSPYAIFDATGSAITGSSTIKSESVYALFARTIEQKPATLLLDGLPSLNLQDHGAPAGWNRGDNSWHLLQVRTEKISRISIGLSGEELLSSERRVNTQDSPKLIEVEAVVGAWVDGFGAPLRSLPAVFLPASGIAETFTWQITLLNADIGTPAFEASSKASTEISRVYLPLDLPNGRYTIRVEGRKGYRLSFNFALVRNLQLSFTTDVRLFERSSGELEATSATIEASANPKRCISLGEGQISAAEDVDGVFITVEPPRIQLRLDNQESSKQLPRQAQILKESLVESVLRVTWPSGSTLANKLRIVDSTGSVLASSIEPTTSASNFAEFKLAKINDVVPTNKICWLELFAETEPIVVGRVSPQRILDGCVIQPGDYRLELQTSELPVGLKAGFFSSLASWRDPVIVDVTGKYPEVPAEILAAGPFKVLFQLDDGWTPLTWSRRLGGNPNAYSLNANLPVEPTTPELALVYWLLTGEKNQELLTQVDQDTLWRCLTDPSVETQKVGRREIEQFCRENLDADPDAAFQHFPKEIHRRDSYLKLMFLADIIDESPRIPAEHLLSLSTAATAPALYAVAAAGELSPGSSAFESAIELWLGRSISSLGDEEVEKEVLVRYLLTLSEWLSSERPDVRHLLKLEEKAFNHVYQEFGLLGPAPLLSVSSCGKLFYEMSQKSEDLWTDIPLVKSGLFFDVFDLEFQRALDNCELTSQLSSLVATRPAWPDNIETPRGSRIVLANVPRLSLRLALLCRLAARGFTAASETWHSFKREHQNLSRILPQVVEFDVLLIELYLNQLLGNGTKNGQD